MICTKKGKLTHSFLLKYNDNSRYFNNLIKYRMSSLENDTLVAVINYINIDSSEYKTETISINLSKIERNMLKSAIRVLVNDLKVCDNNTENNKNNKDNIDFLIEVSSLTKTIWYSYNLRHSSPLVCNNTSELLKILNKIFIEHNTSQKYLIDI